MLRVLSILLAFQVLLSSMSFNVGLHFCNEKLQSLSLYGEATPCEHASGEMDHSSMPDCPFHSKEKPGESKKGCCDDEQWQIEGLDFDVLINNLALKDAPQLDWTGLPFPNSEFSLYSVFKLNSRKFLNYKPPLIQLDIPVLIQSFRI